jgi:hypothetical protein
VGPLQAGNSSFGSQPKLGGSQRFDWQPTNAITNVQMRIGFSDKVDFGWYIPNDPDNWYK